MSTNFWEMQREIAYRDMIASGAALGQALALKKQREAQQAEAARLKAFDESIAQSKRETEAALQRTLQSEIKLAQLDQQSAQLDQQSAQLDQQSAQLDQKAAQLRRETDELRARNAAMEQELERRAQQREADKLFKQRFDGAVEVAKQNGQLPEEFQRTVPEFRLGHEVGMRVVAIRELKKIDPGHPLVHSQGMRDYVAHHTTRNYVRAGMPEGASFEQFVPGEEVVKRGVDGYRVPGSDGLPPIP